MISLTTQLPVQCSLDLDDESKLMIDNKTISKISQLHVLKNMEEKPFDSNTAVNAKDHKNPSYQVGMSATVNSDIVFGLNKSENVIAPSIDIAQKNHIFFNDAKRKGATLCHELEHTKATEKTNVHLKEAPDSVEIDHSFRSTQVDLSSNYSYTIDPEKMVSSLCSSSQTKEEILESTFAEQANHQPPFVIKSNEKWVEASEKSKCSKGSCTEKFENIDKFEIVAATSPPSVSSASILSCTPDHCVQESYMIADKLYSPRSSDSGCVDDISSSETTSKCGTPRENHIICDVTDSESYSSKCLSDLNQKIHVFCQTEVNKDCGELQYAEKISKLSDEILQTLSSIPSSETVEAIAEICLSMKNCAQESSSGENIMKNLVLSFLHVASCWIFLSSCNGLKSIIQLCHPQLNIIFKNWESYTLTFLDYMINFISESKRCVALNSSKEVSVSSVKQTDNCCEELKSMQQLNGVYDNTATNFSNHSSLNLNHETNQVFNEEIPLNNDYFPYFENTMDGHFDYKLVNAMERSSKYKSNLSGSVDLENKKENCIEPAAFDRKFTPVSEIAQRTSSNLVSGIKEANKKLDLEFPLLLTNKGCIENNSYFVHDKISSDFGNNNLKFQVGESSLKTINNFATRKMDRCVHSQETPPQTTIGAVPHTNLSHFSQAEKNYISADMMENSGLWLNNPNEQPLLMHSNSGHYPLNSGSGCYLNLQFQQANNMLNSSLSPVTKKFTHNRKKYHRFKFSTVGNTKTASFNRSNNFKKSNFKPHKSKTAPISLLIDSESSDENSEVGYMKPGSYIVPLKHEEEAREFLPFQFSHQMSSLKSESVVTDYGEISNDDHVWRTACASAAVFLQMFQDRSDSDFKSNSLCFEDSCQNQNLHELKMEDGKKAVQDICNVSNTETKTLLPNLSKTNGTIDMKVMPENHINQLPQDNYTFHGDSDTDRNPLTILSTENAFLDQVTGKKGEPNVQRETVLTVQDDQ